MSVSGNQLYQHYKENDSQVASFFSFPVKPTWKTVCESVLGDFSNSDFLKILAEQNNKISNPKYLKLIDQKNTVVLITGQQLGLFVSPLYTVYKILTTILYSQKLSDEIKDYNFVPVFWLEGEDHDFAEINHALYFDKQGNLAEAIHPEVENETGFSISKRNLSNQILNIINSLQVNLIQTEFSTQLFDTIKNIWKPDIKWNKAFADQIRMIFKDMGLLIFNPSEEQVKRNSIPFFRQLIDNNDAIVHAFVDQSRLTQKAGFNNQVYVDSDKSYIFLSHNGSARVALQKNGSNRFSINNSNTNWDKPQLINLLETNPKWFSSTVLTRPIWQSWMLPVVSYIAGPAEIAYWAQLKLGFETLQVQMPHVMPRFSLTMLEPKIQRLLDKYAIEVNDIPNDGNAFTKQQLKGIQSAEMENEFNQIRNHLSASRDSIEKHVDSIDPTLKSVVQKSFGNADNSIEKVQNRILQRLEEKESLSVNHFKEIHNSIFPNGVPQERVISSIYFLNKYGPSWLNRIVEKIEMDNFDQQIIAL